MSEHGTPESRPSEDRYPLLKQALAEGKIDGSTLPKKREPRCGPWVEREDGATVCQKCGDVDWPNGSGPFGF
jgi:hypothetical protein